MTDRADQEARPQKRGRGRPRKKVTVRMIDQLARKGLIVEEIASILEVSADTIMRNYAERIQKGHQHRNSSLRRKQFEVAMEGNVAMLIWLGKQLLGQKDKREHSGPESGPIPVTLEGAKAALSDLLADVRNLAENRRSHERGETHPGGRH